MQFAADPADPSEKSRGKKRERSPEKPLAVVESPVSNNIFADLH